MKLNDKKSDFFTIKGIFTNKIVLASIAITTLLITIFHVMSLITLPGIEVPSNYRQASNSFTGMLNLLAGGGLSKLSIFAVGLGPYITAEIISQLLSNDLIPGMTKMAKNGERGRKQIEIISRIITLPFCLAQSYAVIALILNNNANASDDNIVKIFGQKDLADLTFSQIVSLMVIFTAGTYMCIFMSDMITKRGVGNGTTLLILAGIISTLFSDFNVAFLKIADNLGGFSSSTNILSIFLSFGIYILFFFLILALCVFINFSKRKIPIQQTGQGLITNIDALPYLPIKVNSAGVIPVIFASSIMTIPGTIAQFMGEGEGKTFILNYLVIDSWIGLTIYFLLTFVFVFFYSYIQINPSQMAENFEKSGKFIPGVKSGKDTEKHIIKVLNRINWIGAPFLSIIAVLPYIISIISGIPSGIALGGTGIIIIVSACCELWNSTKSTATTTGYNISRTKIENKLLFDAEEGKVEELW